MAGLSFFMSKLDRERGEGVRMNKIYIAGEFINDLERILVENIPGIDSDVLNNIKLDSSGALDKILIKHKVFRDIKQPEP